MAKTKANKRNLSSEEINTLLNILKNRFEKNMKRHKGIQWKDVEKAILKKKEKLRSLNEMETTGGEPDVIGFDRKSGEYIFCDCSPESPNGRRSICYDREAQLTRKEHAPKNNAMDMASDMGIDILTEEQYIELQKLGDFDSKTSSWLKTPEPIRKLGGAIFGDYRYERVFISHNGAQSYYSSRGFRGILKV